MFSKKGQVSVEFIILIGFSLVLIGGLLVLFTGILSDSKDDYEQLTLFKDSDLFNRISYVQSLPGSYKEEFVLKESVRNSVSNITFYPLGADIKEVMAIESKNTAPRFVPLTGYVSFEHDVVEMNKPYCLYKHECSSAIDISNVSCSQISLNSRYCQKIEIFTCDDLEENVRLYPNGKLILRDNIDCTGKTYFPFNPFSGTLDFNGKYIYNVEKSLPNNDNIGLFSEIMPGAILIDIWLKDFNLEGKDSVGGLAGTISTRNLINTKLENINIVGKNYLGGLAGQFTSEELNNVEITNIIINGDTNIGGLAGNFSVLSNTISSITLNNVYLKGSNTIGGVTGTISDKLLSEIIIDGAEIIGDSRLGAISGYANRVHLTKSSANDITVKGKSVGIPGEHLAIGGIFSLFDNSSISLSSFTNTNIIGNSYVGGIAGVSKNSSSKNIYLENFTVDGNTKVGGLYGLLDSSKANNISYTNFVVGASSSDYGGFCGFSQDSSIIDITIQTLDLTGGGTYSGGICGRIEGGLVSGVSGDVSSTSQSKYLGGITGYSSAKIENISLDLGLMSSSSYVSGIAVYNDNLIRDVTVSGYIKTLGVGHIAGISYENQEGAIIDLASSNLILTADNFASALVYKNSGLVNRSESYSSLAFTQSNKKGGLVYENSVTGAIDQSYFQGQFPLTVINHGSLSNSYVLTTKSLSGQSYSDYDLGPFCYENYGTIYSGYSNNIFHNRYLFNKNLNDGNILYPECHFIDLLENRTKLYFNKTYESILPVSTTDMWDMCEGFTLPFLSWQGFNCLPDLGVVNVDSCDASDVIFNGVPSVVNIVENISCKDSSLPLSIFSINHSYFWDNRFEEDWFGANRFDYYFNNSYIQNPLYNISLNGNDFFITDLHHYIGLPSYSTIENLHIRNSSYIFPKTFCYSMENISILYSELGSDHKNCYYITNFDFEINSLHISNSSAYRSPDIRHLVNNSFFQSPIQNNRLYALKNIENMLVIPESSSVADLTSVGYPSDAKNSFVLFNDDVTMSSSNLFPLAVLLNKSTYQGWDFDSTWDMIDGCTLPYLRFVPDYVPRDYCLESRAFCSFSKGNGSQDSPYVISDYDDFLCMKDYYGSYFELEHDIDASITKSPDYNNGTGHKEFIFKGYFNGNGHTINDLTIHHNRSVCSIFDSFSGEFTNVTFNELSADCRNKSIKYPNVFSYSPVNLYSVSFTNISLFYDTDNALRPFPSLTNSIVTGDISAKQVGFNSFYSSYINLNMDAYVSLPYISKSFFKIQPINSLSLGSSYQTVEDSFISILGCITDFQYGLSYYYPKSSILEVTTTCNSPYTLFATERLSSISGPISSPSYVIDTLDGNQYYPGFHLKHSTQAKHASSFPELNFSSNWDIDEGCSYPFPKSVGNYHDTTCETNPYVPYPFSGGSGSIEDPFKISTKEDFTYMKYYGSKNYELTNDINLGFSDLLSFRPIGLAKNTFFNGNGHTLSSSLLSPFTPFFTALSHNHTVSNSTFSAEIYDQSKSNSIEVRSVLSGIIQLSNWKDISINVIGLSNPLELTPVSTLFDTVGLSNSSNWQVYTDSISGLSTKSFNFDSLNNSIFVLKNNSFVTANFQGASLKNTSLHFDSMVPGSYFANFFGVQNVYSSKISSKSLSYLFLSYYSNLVNSSLQSSVAPASSNIGGLAKGSISGSLSNSSMDLYIKGTSVGGIGFNPEGNLYIDTLSSITSFAQGTDRVGGIGVTANPSLFTLGGDGSITLTVNGDDYVGGYFGHCAHPFSISNNISTSISVLGRNYVGGYCGLSSDSSQGISTNALVFGENYVGGLYGKKTAGNTAGSHFNGTIISKSVSGGLVGEITGGSISSSYFSGVIIGENVSGIVGKISSGEIKDVYSIGILNGFTSSSLLAHENIGGNTHSSYVALDTSSPLLSEVAYSPVQDYIYNNYYDSDVTTVSSSVYSIPKTTSELTSGTGLSFLSSSDWKFIPGYYPCFTYQDTCFSDVASALPANIHEVVDTITYQDFYENTFFPGDLQVRGNILFNVGATLYNPSNPTENLSITISQSPYNFASKMTSLDFSVNVPQSYFSDSQLEFEIFVEDIFGDISRFTYPVSVLGAYPGFNIVKKFNSDIKVGDTDYLEFEVPGFDSSLHQLFFSHGYSFYNRNNVVKEIFPVSYAGSTARFRYDSFFPPGTPIRTYYYKLTLKDRFENSIHVDEDIDFKYSISDPYKMHILVFPIGFDNTSADLADFRGYYTDGLNRFFENTLLQRDSCFSDKVNIVELPYMPYFDSYSPSISDQSLLSSIMLALDYEHSSWDNYDIKLGLIKEPGSLVSNGAWGIHFENGVLVSGYGDLNVIPHEVGHSFGLFEEYCSMEAGSLNFGCNAHTSQNTIRPVGSLVSNYDPPNQMAEEYSCNPYYNSSLDSEMKTFLSTTGKRSNATEHCCFKSCYQSGNSPVVCCIGNTNEFNEISYMGPARVETIVYDASPDRAFMPDVIAYFDTIPMLRCD